MWKTNLFEKSLAICSRSGSIHFWNVDRNTLIHELDLHTGSPRCNGECKEDFVEHILICSRKNKIYFYCYYLDDYKIGNIHIVDQESFTVQTIDLPHDQCFREIPEFEPTDDKLIVQTVGWSGFIKLDGESCFTPDERRPIKNCIRIFDGRVHEYDHPQHIVGLIRKHYPIEKDEYDRMIIKLSSDDKHRDVYLIAVTSGGEWTNQESSWSIFEIPSGNQLPRIRDLIKRSDEIRYIEKSSSKEFVVRTSSSLFVHQEVDNCWESMIISTPFNECTNPLSRENVYPVPISTRDRRRASKIIHLLSNVTLVVCDIIVDYLP